MRRLLLLVLLLVLLPAVPATAQPQGGPVVVVGVAGLRWSDVGAATPVLRELAGRSAVGVLSVKALPAVTCPGDGWLTLGAGARAEAFGGADDPCDARLPADLLQQRRRNADSRDGAVLGALATALDGRLEAQGPGAQTAAGTGVRRAPARVTLFDAGAVTADDRAGSLRRVDAEVGRVLGALPAGADLLLVGLSEGPGESTARLHVALATGPSWPRGALRSASTRRAPYVQLVDVAPTVLDLVGRPVPDAMDGQPWQVAGRAPALDELADLEQRAVVAKRTTVPFYVVVIGALLVLLLALRRRPPALRLVALTGTAALGASYAAMLVPWWRAPAPLAVLVATTAVLALGAALAARSAAGVCGLTALLLVADLLAGAPLQVDSPAGYSPLVAGRFAGLGNVAFGVYGTAWLLATAALAAGRPRRTAALVVAACGTVAVVLDGAPPWGSDVGGVLALVPAFTVLGLLVSRTRVSVSRVLLAGLAGALVVAAFALLDLSRPAADRTHLGRFAADVRDGTAGELLQRKAEAVFGLLFSSPVTALLPLVVAAAVALLLRPPPALRTALAEVPWLRPGLVAVGVLSAVGFLVNDSGAAVPALALLVAVPATVAVVAEQRAGPARRTPQEDPALLA